MSATRPAIILKHLDGPGAADAELLARFAAAREAAAFEELVRRHGPLVLGVCRRVIGHPQDAEDAFQAVFLVLAQKAGSLRAGALGSWLYGVAYRVALRARRANGRRRAREVTMSNPPEPPAPDPRPALSELAPVLDAELAALPAHYRDAIVLCDLQGASREAAAAALGVPEGTVSSRLANGRKRLAARLARRGVALSVAALPAALAEARAAPAVPPELVSRTARVAADVAAGGAVPGPMIRLLEGGSAMRKVLIVSAALVATVAGVVLAARPGAEPPKSEPPRVVAERGAEPPKHKDEPKPAPEKAVAFGAPKLARATDLPISQVDAVLWNAAGTHLAVQGRQPTGAANGKTHRSVVVLCEARDAAPFIEFVGDGDQLVGFGADGKSFVSALREYHLISGRHELKFWTVVERPPGPPGFDAPGVELQRGLKLVRTLKLEATETHTYAFAPDLKSYRTVALERNIAGEVSKLVPLEVDAATGKARELVPLAYRGAYALSGDGKRLAVFNGGLTRGMVYDLDREEDVAAHAFKDVSEPKRPQPDPERGAVWLSPDGKRLVVSRGVSWTAVLNADGATTLPDLEGARELRTSPSGHCFGAGGRLLAATCQVYRTETIKTVAGQEQTSWSGLNQWVLAVWDTQTGKALKSWKHKSVQAAFCPTKPLLAILEPSESETRLGFWDFAAEVEKK